MLGAQEREQGEDLATVCASELLCQRNILSERARVVVAHMRSVPHTHTHIYIYTYTNTQSVKQEMIMLYQACLVSIKGQMSVTTIECID